MNKLYKRAVRSLRWAVKQGAMTDQDAIGVLALAASSGYFGEIHGSDRDPDADEPSSTVRGKGTKMATVKKRTDPAALKGSKAGQLFNGARVKDASERLSNVKTVVKDRTGNALRWGSKTVETPSERDNAVIGVWFKRLMQKSGVPGIVFTDFERALFAETIQKGRWVGEVNGTYFGGGADASDFVPNTMVKALLDDTISGGIYLNPVEFDSAVITYPLLHGELFPLVELIPVTGRRIQGAAISNVTMAWGQTPGNAIQPFNTTSLVSELSTPVFGLAGAIEVSNELMADSPVAIGSTVTALYSERQKSELDRVIVAGNGTNEPTGVLNTSGLVSVSSDNGNGGPPTVSDYEGLIFSVGKQYRQKGLNAAFAANDTTYRRARGIAVGPGDERRVFGMDHQSYQLLEYGYKIQNDMPNAKALFGCWSKFRMYQRLGSEVTVTREGRTLALANTTLVVVRSRFGGKVVDANAFALCSDMQS